MKLPTIRFYLLSTVLFHSSVWAQDLSAVQPDLRFSVYSTSAAELSWDRIPDENGPPVYELVRNREIVYRGFGLSFFDPTLNPTSENTYALTVFGETGDTSNTTMVTF